MRLVAIFGGTGFLGRRVVERLAREGVSVRVAVRHPKRATTNAGREDTREPILVPADIRDEQSVAVAVEGADGVVNAVSAYVEKGGVTYKDVHVNGARNVARACLSKGVRRLVHISGSGADPKSSSRYIRARGEGELAVQQLFPKVTILRPSVMFAPDDAFLNALAQVIRLTPVVPLIGGGRTRMQPIHVSDVAEAACICFRTLAAVGQIYELGGPEVYTLRAVIEVILARTGRRRLLVPVPFTLAHPLASLLQLLQRAPLTIAQVDLLRNDNVPVAHALGTKDLGIAPQRLEDVIPNLVSLQPP